MHPHVKKILVSEEEIKEKSIQLGSRITKDYEPLEKKPVFIALLKGSVPFLAELIKHIEFDLELDFMDVSSYEGTQSVRDIRILKDLDRSIVGESVLLVEDIVDTGRTVQEVSKMLYNKGAIDVKVVSLLDKPSRREVEVNIDYIGFEIPNEFVIGFGLDYNEKYRNLPFVGVLKDEFYQ